MRNVANLIALVMVLINWSCTSFDQAYYERVSGIKLPLEAEVVESYDNAEYLTIITLKIDSLSLRTLIKKYNFKKADQTSFLSFLGLIYLEDVKPDLNQKGNLHVRSASKGKVSWLYVIDLQRQILWAEVQYPDWSGT